MKSVVIYKYMIYISQFILSKIKAEILYTNHDQVGGQIQQYRQVSVLLRQTMD